MSFSIGLVGLPNVGKSTLFHAITKKQVPMENYPFCTIDPHVGTVAVPDPLLKQLARVEQSKKIIQTTIEFTDIAGLVKGAHKGEGLGNKFLSHIREVDAICQVVRVFENDSITHVHDRIDPLEDIEIVNLELIMADIATIEKRREGLIKKLKGKPTKDEVALDAILEKGLSHLKKERLLSNMEITNEERKLLKINNLLTIKPMLYVCNVADTNSAHNLSFKLDKPYITLSVRLESDLTEMDEEESKIFLKDAGLTQSGLDSLIQKGYDLLSLITYYTAGPEEARAWTIPKNTSAKDASGVIHSDISEGFIKGEVVSAKKFIDAGGWSGVKEKGVMRTEGKNYIMREDDVAYFHFSK